MTKPYFDGFERMRRAGQITGRLTAEDDGDNFTGLGEWEGAFLSFIRFGKET
jgi:hypothetical protein